MHVPEQRPAPPAHAPQAKLVPTPHWPWSKVCVGLPRKASADYGLSEPAGRVQRPLFNGVLERTLLGWRTGWGATDESPQNLVFHNAASMMKFEEFEVVRSIQTIKI
eukprot:7473859-Pyramimonas_sp.AAC.1